MRCSDYNTLIFDCDGVVLNSNTVKTSAFYQAALPYGAAAAQELVNYHVSNGGVSRYRKFVYFLEHLVEKILPDYGLDELLRSYAENVYQGLRDCEIALDLDILKAQTPNAKWLIISGGDQQELQDLFKFRNLYDLFDAGIFGSPDTKDEIIKRELRAGNIKFPAVFFGDSQYDYEAAKRAGMDFVFVEAWSESRFEFKDADLKIDKLSDILQYV